jgi:DNA-binding response OmpR family regulator
MINILVVEDDEHTLRFLQDVLKSNGYTPFLAEDGKKALEVLAEQHIDLMIADIMLPEMDGYELTRQLRTCNYMLPILMVTAKQLPEDKREGFRVGTDDYMTKPFDVVELLLRIKALLRRAQIVDAHKIMIGEVTLDYDALTVERDSEIQMLPPKEFYLLYKLLSWIRKAPIIQ